MRTLMLSLAAGLALSGLLAPVGRGDDHSAHGNKKKEENPYQPRLSTYASPPVRPAQLSNQPPAEPYRSLYFFPKDPPARPADDQVRDVTLYDSYFSPRTLSIPSGMTVRWTNEGSHEHTTTADWLWESGDLRRGKSFSITFSRPGTYYYYCRHHPQDMRGTIVVFRGF